MINKINKSIFYVSNLGTNKISIINGEDFNVIGEVKVGPRPFEMAVDNKSNIFIATDRNDKVTIINGVTREVKSIFIPNNGHVKVDSISKKIYVSNTEEVYIYSLENEKIIDKISGFIAVDGIELNSDGSKLFTLDIFQNEVRIYDTLSLKLVKTYKDIGESPNYFYIGEDDRYLYISNKGIDKFGLSGNLILIDLSTDSISFIRLPKGSIITSIDSKDSFLYIVNSGLNRVDVIDFLKKSIVDSLRTSLNNPQKIKILKDINLLLVTSKDNMGRGALDIFDINNKKIVSTFNFEEKNSNPYDIVVIQEDHYKENALLSNNLKKIDEENDGEYILANKVLSTYKEKLIFKQEKIELIYENKIDIEEIIFESCKVIEESKNKEHIKNKKNYIILNFEFTIPYYIKCVNSKKEKINIKGNLRGKQKAVLYTSKGESNDFEFAIKSSTEIISFPYIEDNFIIFDVSSIISTYLIKEELILIPSKEINDNLMEDKNEEIQ